MRAHAFFPRRLHPVLDSGERDENSVISPEMPTGALEGKAVLDDHADGKINDTAGIVGFVRGEIVLPGAEEEIAGLATVLGVGKKDIRGNASPDIAEIMEPALHDAVARSGFSATGADPRGVASGAQEDGGGGHVFKPLRLAVIIRGIVSGLGHGGLHQVATAHYQLLSESCK